VLPRGCQQRNNQNLTVFNKRRTSPVCCHWVSFDSRGHTATANGSVLSERCDKKSSPKSLIGYCHLLTERGQVWRASAWNWWRTPCGDEEAHKMEEHPDIHRQGLISKIYFRWPENLGRIRLYDATM